MKQASSAFLQKSAQKTFAPLGLRTFKTPVMPAKAGIHAFRANTLQLGPKSPCHRQLPPHSAGRGALFLKKKRCL
jgi:hypothetical protein